MNGPGLAQDVKQVVDECHRGMEKEAQLKKIMCEPLKGALIEYLVHRNENICRENWEAASADP